MWCLGHSDESGLRGEVCVLSTRRGAGKKSSMLVATIRKKSKNRPIFVCDSGGSDEKEGRMEQIQGGGEINESRKLAECERVR